jgi:hypothetical protein
VSKPPSSYPTYLEYGSEKKEEERREEERLEVGFRGWRGKGNERR